jgi:hypothetical protein
MVVIKRRRLVRQQRAMGNYLDSGSLTGDIHRDPDVLTFEWDFTRRESTATAVRRVKRRAEASGVATRRDGSHVIETIIQVVWMRWEGGNARWWARVRWAGHEQLGFADSWIPVRGANQAGGALNGEARKEARALMMVCRAEKRAVRAAQRKERDASAGEGTERPEAADDRDLISLRVRQRGRRARAGVSSSRLVAGKRSRAAERGSLDEDKEEDTQARTWAEAEVEVIRGRRGLYDEEEVEEDDVAGQETGVGSQRGKGLLGLAGRRRA